MLLEQVLTEKKVVDVKQSSSPRNTLAAKALADMADDMSDLQKEKIRTTLRNKISSVIRKGQKLWTLDTGKIMYKMVTPKDTE